VKYEQDFVVFINDVVWGFSIDNRHAQQ